VIPDESFLRLRGALFFGPGFLVTRNKLTFRDNLQECLATAVPSQSPQISHTQHRIVVTGVRNSVICQFSCAGTKRNGSCPDDLPQGMTACVTVAGHMQLNRSQL